MQNRNHNINRPFPRPIPLKNLLGPSFIILALGLGSGEVILWPFLSANFGLGIAWGALLGITFQFFINMEIERYALIKGESVFVGLNKIFPWAAHWFIISTFVGFGLPGIVAASAHIIGFLFNIEDFRLIAVILLILIGLILSIGKSVYTVMERLTKTIIFIGIPFIVILTFTLARSADWISLGQGLVGIGNDYFLFPAGLVIATFFAAFAYSGAGGNLNLTQSIYIKEKGYGMGKYSQKISGLFTNLKQNQHIKLEGEEFDLSSENVKNFEIWWKRINIEHFLIFWLVGITGILTLMMLAFVTAFGLDNNATGINFVINEGMMIGEILHPLMGILFLVVAAVMLFQTQLGVLDSTSRIMAENLAIKKLEKSQNQTINLSKVYFSFLWAQILFGITLFALNISEPKFLIVLGAVLNAIAMFIHIGLVNYMNNKALPMVFRPKIFRKIILSIIFSVFGIFSLVTILDNLKKII